MLLRFRSAPALASFLLLAPDAALVAQYRLPSDSVVRRIIDEQVGPKHTAGLVIGLLFGLGGGLGALVTALIGAVTGFVLLWAVGAAGTRMFKEEAMGGGDIKMMAMVGAFVGWQGVLLTIFLGALLGTVIFVPLSLIGQKRLVPFGVFLSLGAATTWLAGPAVIMWYRTFVLQP